MAYSSSAHPLDTGEPFPALSLALADGSTLTLPKPGRWSVFVIYRGEW